MEHIVSVHDLFLTLTPANGETSDDGGAQSFEEIRLRRAQVLLLDPSLEMNDTTNRGSARDAHAQTI